MSIIEAIILSVHGLLLLMLCLFGLHRLSMVYRWFFYRNQQPVVQHTFDDLPVVTVQIPLYNEQFVAQRIIDAVVAIDYPREKLQLQMVDDSTDTTQELIKQRIAEYKKQGIDIDYIHRNNRQGYKAGALKEAMEYARGEFIAIFDADFLPPENILKQTIHHFTDKKIGMVQCRWEHLNRDNTRLTELQSVMLDAHFGLEQYIRSASGMFLNFNGTAGIWRKETIYDAGNWSADTLTEDLDLSYRAQLKGWKMLYVNNIDCPAEVPSDMNAFKSQQHRWAKGGVEVLLKLFKTIWRSPITLKEKIEATFHMSNNLAYLILLIDTVFFLVPSVFIRDQYAVEYIWWLDLPLLIASSTGHIIYLIFGQYVLQRPMLKVLINAPWLLLLGIQISFNNARAGLEALAGHRTEFVRTPKSGELSKRLCKSDNQKNYRPVAPKGAFFELLLAIIFCVIFAWCVEQKLWLMLPFMLFLIVGYATTSIDSFISYRRLRN